VLVLGVGVALVGLRYGNESHHETLPHAIMAIVPVILGVLAGAAPSDTALRIARPLLGAVREDNQPAGGGVVALRALCVLARMREDNQPVVHGLDAVFRVIILTELAHTTRA